MQKQINAKRKERNTHTHVKRDKQTHQSPLLITTFQTCSSFITFNLFFIVPNVDDNKLLSSINSGALAFTGLPPPESNGRSSTGPRSLLAVDSPFSFNLVRHRHKRLFNIRRVLRRCFHERDAILLMVSLFTVNSSLSCLIFFAISSLKFLFTSFSSIHYVLILCIFVCIEVRCVLIHDFLNLSIISWHSISC